MAARRHMQAGRLDHPNRLFSSKEEGVGLVLVRPKHNVGNVQNWTNFGAPFFGQKFADFVHNL